METSIFHTKEPESIFTLEDLLILSLRAFEVESFGTHLMNL